ncbi:MAG: formylglycine-generating enzyme family protein [Alphaproteobacteria bacterium]
MAALPAGAFIMGGEPRGIKDSQRSQSPPHCATVRRPFAIGRTEVTVAQWQSCVDAGRCRPLLGKRERLPNEPAADTTWTMARDYATWLAERTGQHYRLPSEVEWEFATRAGTDTLYWWGESPLPGMENMIICPRDSHGEGDDRCQGPRRVLPVATFRANAFGLYDTIGNAEEWVEDLFSYYKKEPRTEDPRYPPEENRHAIRRGTFRDYPDPRAGVYVSTVDSRSAAGPSVEILEKKGELTGDTYGFRVARDLPAATQLSSGQPPSGR